MKMMKKVWGFLLVMVMLLSLNFQAFAADENINPIFDNVVVNDTDFETSTRDTMGDYTVISSKVYPANTISGRYYSPYTTLPGGSQWSNGSLSNAGVDSYYENDCDGFYVEAKINPGSATSYKLYSNGTFVKQGSTSQNMTISVMVKNNNPGNWRVVLYRPGDSVGIPVWGYIRLR